MPQNRSPRHTVSARTELTYGRRTGSKLAVLGIFAALGLALANVGTALASPARVGAGNSGPNGVMLIDTSADPSPHTIRYSGNLTTHSFHATDSQGFSLESVGNSGCVLSDSNTTLNCSFPEATLVFITISTGNAADQIASLSSPTPIVNLTISSGGGNDTVTNNLLDDSQAYYVDGGTGNDTLTLGDGSDIIIGGSGNDEISGDGGNDLLIPGIGDDTVNGGTGNDTISYAERTSKVTAVLGATASNGTDTENDEFTGGIENLYSGSGDDVLRGDSAANIVASGDGDDYIETTDRAADSAFCGNGSDTVSADALDAVSSCERTAVSMPLPASGGTGGSAPVPPPSRTTTPISARPVDSAPTTKPSVCTTGTSVSGVIRGPQLTRSTRLQFKLSSVDFVPGRSLALSIYTPGSAKSRQQQLQAIRKLVKKVVFRAEGKVVAVLTPRASNARLATADFPVGGTKLTAELERKTPQRAGDKRDRPVQLTVTCS